MYNRVTYDNLLVCSLLDIVFTLWSLLLHLTWLRNEEDGELIRGGTKSMIGLVPKIGMPTFDKCQILASVCLVTNLTCQLSVSKLADLG